MRRDERRKPLSRFTWVAAACVSMPLFYALSSGPVTACAFWLREATGWDGFYAVLWVYYPLFAWKSEVFRHYIDWWVVDVFHTVGPG